MRKRSVRLLRGPLNQLGNADAGADVDSKLTENEEVGAEVDSIVV